MSFYGFLIANGVFWIMFWASLTLLYSINATEKDKIAAEECGLLGFFSLIYLIAVIIGGLVS